MIDPAEKGKAFRAIDHARPDVRKLLARERRKFPVPPSFRKEVPVYRRRPKTSRTVDFYGYR